MTVHRLEEYGKVVMVKHVFGTLSAHFCVRTNTGFFEIGIFLYCKCGNFDMPWKVLRM